MRYKLYFFLWFLIIYFDKLLNNDVGCFLTVASRSEKVATYLTVTQIAMSLGIILGCWQEIYAFMNLFTLSNENVYPLSTTSCCVGDNFMLATLSWLEIQDIGDFKLRWWVSEELVTNINATNG